MAFFKSGRATPGWRTVVLAAVATLAITGCSSEESSEDSDRLILGALMPMTGDLQAYGETSLNGIKLAVMHVNRGGGVLGKNMAVEVGDTQTTPQSGIDAAKKLISIEGADAIVGALSSGVSIPVAQSVTSQDGVPQISGASTSPVITGLDDDDYMFRTVPSDAFQGKALAEVVDADGLGNVATLYINNDYGEGLSDSFSSAFEALGGTVSAALAYEPGNASYRGELSKAADGGAEALVLIGYPENGVTILRQALESGTFDRFVFTDGLKAPEIIDAVGADALEGSYGTAPQALSDSEAAKNFTGAYESEFGERPPKPFIDTAYDAAFVIALAAQKAGKADGTAIRDALRDVANPPGEVILPGEWEKAMELLENGEDIDYKGASGSIDFDDNGDVGGTFAHWAIKGGKIETVKVFEPSS
ncbi:MAG: ABC transporter substrate-binding protein [Halofilum sp. (in: g-proteobacteria)]|nr:ABC transporter substrate-binding protein [Halofilum sp. (in: g-proteobacteria)]